MRKVSKLICVSTICASTFGGSLLLSGCEQAASAADNVEKLPAVQPTLPPVPTLPPAPYPIQFGDQSYSVYGVRRAIRRTIDTDLGVTGYLADVFVPPECEKRKKCPLPPAPHMFLADTPTETDKRKMLLVAGYAENQDQLDEAFKAAKKGRPILAPEGSGMITVPTDFFKGAKIKVTGQFSYMSGSGFQSSEGVLTYGGHETLEPSADDPIANKKRR